MGATESKDENKRYELFSAEEKMTLQENFFKLSGGLQKTDRGSVEVRIKVTYHSCQGCFYSYILMEHADGAKRAVKFTRT